MILTEGKYICINDKHEYDHLIKGDIYELKHTDNSGISLWTISKNDNFVTSFRHNSSYHTYSFFNYFRSLLKEERKLKLQKINENR